MSYPSTRVANNRSLNWIASAMGRVAVAAAYVAALSWVYTDWLSPRYAYLGFPYNPEPFDQLAIAYILSALPAALLPRRFNRPSDYLNWTLFYIVYIPSAFIPALEGLISKSIQFSILLFISFAIMLYFPRVKMPSIKLPTISKEVFWSTFFVLYGALAFYVFFTFRDVIHVASLDEVYIQRQAGGDAQQGSLAGYAAGLLSGAFDPFMLAIGTTKRNPVLIVLGLVTQVLVYSTIASKAAIIIGLVVPLAAIYLVRGKKQPSPALIGLGMVVCAFVPMALYSISAIPAVSYFVEDNIMPLLYVRTLEMPGGLTGLYGGFFETHPVTHFSHIGIVGKFIHYPYDLPLGLIIGYWVVGGPLDANANFFATDGLAAFGYIGLLIAGFAAGLVFRVADKMLPLRVSAPFCAAASAAILTLANASLFTTLVTGGLGVLVLLFVFWAQVREEAKPSELRHPARSPARAAKSASSLAARIGQESPTSNR